MGVLGDTLRLTRGTPNQRLRFAREIRNQRVYLDSTHAEGSAEMKELFAFLLPPAVALTGMRVNHLLFGREFEPRFGGGLKFTLGLAIGMLAFSQAVLLGALAGVNLAGWLAWLALIWG